MVEVVKAVTTVESCFISILAGVYMGSNSSASLVLE